ncbi:transposase family protein [Arthrobacter glacialis]|uniref:transposase family protein n=1 Tax=Arthrobacter glacialis TaxID=1664 RepID=UPI00105735F7|nr:transposase family protein [Arthrobacter glacialis]
MTADELSLDLAEDGATASPRQHLLNADEETQVVAMYLAGVTAKDVAAKFGVHRLTVSRAARRAGGRVGREPLTEREVEKAATSYTSGMSIAAVAKELSLPRESIRRQLIVASVEMRAKDRTRE